MRTQRFGKYLSQPGLQDAIKTEAEAFCGEQQDIKRQESKEERPRQGII
jgi:hypothetical protein